MFKEEEGCWSLCCKWKMEDESFVPLVPPSGPRRNFPLSPASTFSNMTTAALSFLFTERKKPPERQQLIDHMWQACVWMASPFRWPLLNGAACWHSKRQRTTNTNQSSPLACFDPLPKNAITGPYPGVPSTLLWIKDTGKRGKDKNLALYPIFCPLCFF